MSHNRLLRAVAMLLAAGVVLWAQSSGKLTGRVTDSQGQGLANVNVLLITSSGATERTATGPDGTFTFNTLNTGSYRVEIESAGVTQRGGQPLEIMAGSSTPIEMIFRSEETSAGRVPVGELEIRAAAPTIQADSAEVSRAYETRTVRSLPLIDRQYQELIGLMPGVTPPAISEDRILDPQRTRTFNVNGQAGYANAWFQDGAYQSELYNAGPARIAPNSSVQQMNVRTSNFNAEHGFAGGSSTNTVTRPGTNPVHGSVFGFNTNRFFATRNPLNTTGDNPGFNVNQFGGSVGGPIVRNKTFFFADYEGYLRGGSILQLTSVPTADLRAGNFSQFTGTPIFNPASGNAAGQNRVPFPGNQIPGMAINPAAQAILGALPLPNQPGLVNNLVGGVRLLERQHRADGKIDHRFSEKSTGFFRYGFTHGLVDRGSLLGPLGDAAQSALRNHNAVASLTQSFNNNLAGEFRVGYFRYRNAIGPWTGFGLDSSSQFANDLNRFNFAQGLPQINIAGFGTLGLPGNYPSKAVNNTWDFATNWNWHNGMHHLKFGAQVIPIRADGFDGGAFSPRGSFFFGPGATASPTGQLSQFNPAANGFAAFLTGAPTSSGVSTFLETPSYRQTLISGYVTDTINLWQNVHLELGVRYDIYSPLETRRAGASSIFNPFNNQVEFGGGNGSDNRGDREWDRNNVAPRIGIVIRPFEKMAIRAGYGIHYFPTPFSLAGVNQVARAIQAGNTGGFGTGSFTVPVVPGQTTGNAAGNQPLFVTSADVRTPYVQTYNLMLQGDLGNGFLLDAGYVGTLGRQLPLSRDLNVGLPGSGVAGLPFFSQFNRTASTTLRGNGLNSNYNSLQVNLTKRFAAGLSFSGAYTFSKALDTGFVQSNPFDTRANYGPADWDRTHVLAISHLWQLPFGPGSRYFTSGWAAHILGNWELNGILRWATGTPYTVTADALGCNCLGLGSVRANFTGQSSIDGSSGFDGSQFTLPAAGTFGAQGRNSFRGPELFTYDLALFRNFPIRESFKIELRAEAYNVTNSTNFANPVSTLGSPSFGRSIRTLNGVGGRQFQIGARLLF